MSLTPCSLTKFLIEDQRAGRINPDLRLLIEVVARACKTISIAVAKGALGGVLGDAPMQAYVGDLLAGTGGPRGKDFNMRWVASMVADVHRILTRGGIFSYPLDSKCAAKGGKLRLMYEANPMSFLVEQAGGAASTGRQRMLDVQPGGLHMRVPVFLGSKAEVDAAVGYHLAADAARAVLKP